MIMPLANSRDKLTQVIWGIRDFQSRFGRPPEGMWLPETAVDLEIARHHGATGNPLHHLEPGAGGAGSPDQHAPWTDVSGGRIDPTMAYRLRLRIRTCAINIFFYDGPISHGVAFEGLLDNGEKFAQRLLGAFSEQARLAGTGPHRHRRRVLWPPSPPRRDGAHLRAGPHRVQGTRRDHQLRPVPARSIRPPTTWRSSKTPPGAAPMASSAGGRTADAIPGARDGTRHGAAPLRAALDALRDKLAARFEQTAGALLKDPWAARNDYIDVLLDRSREKRLPLPAQPFLARAE